VDVALPNIAATRRRSRAAAAAGAVGRELAGHLFGGHGAARQPIEGADVGMPVYTVPISAGFSTASWHVSHNVTRFFGSWADRC
jgi:hypothetical protein